MNLSELLAPTVDPQVLWSREMMASPPVVLLVDSVTRARGQQLSDHEDNSNVRDMCIRWTWSSIPGYRLIIVQIDILRGRFEAQRLQG